MSEAPRLTPPARIYQFGGAQRALAQQAPSGDRIDAQFEQLIESIRATQEVLGRIVRSDGELRSGSVTPEALDPEFKTKLFDEITKELSEIRDLVRATGHEAQAQAKNAQKAARDAITGANYVGEESQRLQAQVQELLNRSETAKKVALEAESRISDIQSSLLARASVLEQDGASAGAYAKASMEWAEHMPGTLPADTVAVMDMTGEHWSARWWAHQASAIFGELAAFYQGAHHEPPGQTSSGAPMPPGALYFDLDTNQMYVWNGSSWVPMGVPSKTRTMSLDYKATANQTTFAFGTPDLHNESYLVNAVDPEPVEIFKGGLRQTLDNGTGTIGDYVYDYPNNRIVFGAPLAANTRVAIDIMVRPETLAPGGITKYDLMDIDINPDNGTSGYVDGTRTTFLLKKVEGAVPVFPTANNELEVYVDGTYQQAGFDFYVEADTIVFYVPPQPDSVIFIDFLEPFGGGTGAVTEAQIDCGIY